MSVLSVVLQGSDATEGVLLAGEQASGRQSGRCWSWKGAPWTRQLRGLKSDADKSERERCEWTRAGRWQLLRGRRQWRRSGTMREGAGGREGGGGGISGRRRLCDGRDEIAWGLGGDADVWREGR